MQRTLREEHSLVAHSYYRRRLTNDFKDLTEKEEMELCGYIIDYLCFVHKNKVKFKNILNEKYIEMTFEGALAEYFFREVAKSPQVAAMILNHIGVSKDVTSFIKFFWKHIQVFSILNPYQIDYISDIKRLVTKYDFIAEVMVIKNFIPRYRGMENIPEEHCVRIINKIESLVYLKGYVM